jgi:hypothetical protein
MPTVYGINSRKVLLSDISSITLLNCTNTSLSEDIGGAVLTFSHPNIGCTSSGFTVLLNDVIPWTRITFEVYLTGVASCWAFCEGTNNVPTDANITTWNSGIDRVFFPENCWELPQYTLKMLACDNSSDNFFHGTYHTGTYKKFLTTRRRNSTATLAGLSHGRACINEGTTIVSNIRIW